MWYRILFLMIESGCLKIGLLIIVVWNLFVLLYGLMFFVISLLIYLRLSIWFKFLIFMFKFKLIVMMMFWNLSWINLCIMFKCGYCYSGIYKLSLFLLYIDWFYLVCVIKLILFVIKVFVLRVWVFCNSWMNWFL